jgi:hypothetical protein
LETSFVILHYSVSDNSAKVQRQAAVTYNVDAPIPRNGDDGVQGSQIYADNRHVCGLSDVCVVRGGVEAAGLQKFEEGEKGGVSVGNS